MTDTLPILTHQNSEYKDTDDMDAKDIHRFFNTIRVKKSDPCHPCSPLQVE